jgi:hypothetical protein
VLLHFTDRPAAGDPHRRDALRAVSVLRILLHVREPLCGPAVLGQKRNAGAAATTGDRTRIIGRLLFFAAGVAVLAQRTVLGAAF